MEHLSQILGLQHAQRNVAFPSSSGQGPTQIPVSNAVCGGDQEQTVNNDAGSGAGSLTGSLGEYGRRRSDVRVRVENYSCDDLPTVEEERTDRNS